MLTRECGFYIVFEEISLSIYVIARTGRSFLTERW